MTNMWASIQKRYKSADADDQAVIEHVFDNIIDVVLSDNGGGVLFFDHLGRGAMSVHIIGDAALAPLMVSAAPDIYEKIFGTPENTTLQ
jgi:hypothetical protein